MTHDKMTKKDALKILDVKNSDNAKTVIKVRFPN